MKLATYTTGSGSRHAALIHGVAVSGKVWTEITRLLVECYDYTVTTVDLRGHGLSPRADSYAIRDFSEDLVETLPHNLDLLMGHSLGGRAAVDASYFLHPKQLICLDPGFHLGKVSGFMFVNVLPKMITAPDWLKPYLPITPAETSEEMRQLIVNEMKKWDSKMISGIIERGIGHDYHVASPATPSTVVFSENTFVVTKELIRRLEIAGWNVRFKKNAEHDMYLQDPNGTITLISDLLGPIPVKTVPLVHHSVQHYESQPSL